MNVITDNLQRAFDLAHRASCGGDFEPKAQAIFRAIRHQIWLACGAEPDRLSEPLKGALAQELAERHREEWFILESSPAGADDWTRVSTDTYDSLKRAREERDRYETVLPQYAYRVVRVTACEDPVSAEELKAA